MLLFVCFNRHYLICSAGNHLVQQGRAHFRLMPLTNCGYASLSHVSLPRRFLSNVFCGDKHPDTGVFMRNDFAHNCVPHGENRHTFFFRKKWPTWRFFFQGSSCLHVGLSFFWLSFLCTAFSGTNQFSLFVFLKHQFHDLSCSCHFESCFRDMSCA